MEKVEFFASAVDKTVKKHAKKTRPSRKVAKTCPNSNLALYLKQGDFSPSSPV